MFPRYLYYYCVSVFQAMETAGYVKNVIVSIEFKNLDGADESNQGQYYISMSVYVCVNSPVVCCSAGERHVAEVQTSGVRKEETDLQSVQSESVSPH